MKWRQIPNQLINRLKRRGTAHQNAHSSVKSGKSLSYTVELEVASYQDSTLGTIKKLILENPWSTISSPKLSFETLEGKTKVSITFHTFNEEKAKQIENQLRKALEQAPE